MKNKILFTALLALMGLFTFNLSASADPYHGIRGGKHKHVMQKRGRTIVIWHNNNQRCNMGYRNYYTQRGMCSHMRGMMNHAYGNRHMRCNHRGCSMYGRSYNQGNGRNNYGNDWDDDGHGHHNNGRGNNGRGGR